MLFFNSLNASKLKYYRLSLSVAHFQFNFWKGHILLKYLNYFCSSLSFCFFVELTFLFPCKIEIWFHKIKELMQNFKYLNNS